MNVVFRLHTLTSVITECNFWFHILIMSITCMLQMSTAYLFMHICYHALNCEYLGNLLKFLIKTFFQLYSQMNEGIQ